MNSFRVAYPVDHLDVRRAYARLCRLLTSTPNGHAQRAPWFRESDSMPPCIRRCDARNLQSAHERSGPLDEGNKEKWRKARNRLWRK